MTSSPTRKHNLDLAARIVAEWARTGDVSDELAAEAWATTDFIDLCKLVDSESADALDAMHIARERVRPDGVEPRAGAPAVDWPEIRPLVEPRTLPPWPIHVLPSWMSNHITNMADQLQVPVDLCAQLAVGALSAAAMGHATVRIGPKWTEGVNLYLATVMHSGAGKSPAEKAMTRPLREWEEQRISKARPAILQAERTKTILEKKAKAAEDAAVRGGPDEARLAAAAWMDAEEHPIPPLPRLLADDATPEALVQLLARHGGQMALLSTEADMLDMAAGAYSDGKRPVNLSVYLKGWSGDTIIVDRKGSSSKVGDELRIQHPLLTVSLTMQPTVINWLRASGGQLEGRGLLARFMFAMPQSMRGQRDRMLALSNHVETGVEYGRELTALAESWASWELPAEIPMADDAAVRFVSWVHALEPELAEGRRLAPVAEWAAKLQSSVARFAGLLHLASGANRGPIPIETVELAIEVGEYWITHAVAMAVVTDDDDVARQADVILGWIGRKRVEAFTPRDAWMPLRRQFPQMVDMVPALQVLAACGYIAVTDGSLTDVGVRGARVLCTTARECLAVSEQPLTWSAITRAKCTRALREKKETSLYPNVHVSAPDGSDSPDRVHFARVLASGQTNDPDPPQPKRTLEEAF